MNKKSLLLLLPLVALALAFPSSKSEAAGDKVQIIKFEADWCSACRAMKPVYRQVSRQLSSDASFRTVDVDRQSDLADRYRIRNLPTVVAIKNGRVVARKSGYMDKGRLTAFVKRAL